MATEMITVEEAGQALGVSRSTVWRLIQRGELPSVRRHGRRLVPATAVQTRTRRPRTAAIPPFSHNHPMFRLVGAGRGGGRTPGARDKHTILDR
ncbi:MAG TPA: helix-turn-helix domain-containing protein [Vicinamibacterales bacterium]|nr:helix-turn-helix domain-containing protein [Vicinamibacterales bacterium]